MQENLRRKDALEAWEQSAKLIRTRMELKLPQTQRTWTRDDLYEERMAKVYRKPQQK